MNSARGEVQVTLGKKKLTLRPSFQACQEFEDMVGTTIFEVVKNAVDNTALSFKAAATAIYTGAKASLPETKQDEALSYEEVGELLFAEGLTSQLVPVMQYLSNCVTGDPRGLPEGGSGGK